MNIPVKIIVLLIIHFIADFPLQTNWMAINKSSKWAALSLHIGVYTLVLLIGSFILWPQALNGFITANAALHFVIDAVTSRLTSYLWKREKRHEFFVVIGFDQLLHAISLILTAQYFGVLA